MHRREFLNPKQLAEAAGQVLAVRDAAPAEDAPEFALLRFARRAMATTFELLLPLGTPAALETADAVLDELHRLEDQLTVYHDGSEVSRLNRLAASRPIVVEDRLFQLLQHCARLTDETEGAFDITAGPLIKAWGFFRRQGRVPAECERVQARERVGMKHVRLDPQRRTVAYAKPGVEINLGSIGKGHALDRLGELLRSEWGIRSALVHGGASSVLALGAEPGTGRGWLVGVRHPWRPERRIAQVRLKDQALGTSAATFQHLYHNGKNLGHVLDPRTGWPAQGIASATARAPTAADADALATAFFIHGVDWTKAYCEKHPEVSAILLPDNADQPVLLGSLASEAASDR